MPENFDLFDRIEARMSLTSDLPFEVIMWKPQNIWLDMRRTIFDGFARRSDTGDAEAKTWVGRFRRHEESLQLSLD